MKMLLVLVVASSAGCRDHSGEAHPVGSPARRGPATTTPEPDDSSPSCASVAAALAAQVKVATNVSANVGGAEVTTSPESVHAQIEGGIADACRRGAWSVDTRACAAGWRGNFLLDAAALRAACPGMVKP